MMTTLARLGWPFRLALLAASGCAYDWPAPAAQPPDASAGMLPSATLRSDAGVRTCPDADGCSHTNDSGAITMMADPCAAISCMDHARCQRVGAAASCECLPGFMARGAVCADVDECATGQHGCSPNALCHNTPGGYDCSCKPGFADETGDGKTCTDKCSFAKCDAHANCTIDNGEAKCACATPYVGNGQQCAFDQACEDLGCDPNAQCMISASARSCVCRSGWSGDGRHCTNIDDCANKPCQHGGQCSDLVNGFRCDCGNSGYTGDQCQTLIDHCAPNPCLHDGSCTNQLDGYLCTCQGYGGARCEIDYCAQSPCQHGGRCTGGTTGRSCNCTGTGYKGDSCEIDPCSPSPCGAGLACARTPQGTASCAASCASTSAGCALGATCVADADCKLAGDTDATCDPTAHKCVTVCGPKTVSDRKQFEEVRYCREIAGALTLSPMFDMGADPLPFLTRVTGNLSGISVNAQNFQTPNVNLSALQTVGGDLTFGMLEKVNSVSLPRLSSVGGKVEISFAGILMKASMPQLVSIGGALSMGLDASLSDVDLSKLRSVGGTVTLQQLCRLPWSTAEPLITLGKQPASYSAVGCCAAGPHPVCDPSACGC